MISVLLNMLLICFVYIPTYLLSGAILLIIGLCLEHLLDTGELTVQNLIKNIKYTIENFGFVIIWPLTLIAITIMVLHDYVFVKFKKKSQIKFKNWYEKNKDKTILITKSGRTKKVLYGKKK